MGYFKLTSRNDGDLKSGTFEWDCHRKGMLLQAITVAGVDPCTAQAAKEAGFEWHGATDRQTKEIDGLQDVVPTRAYAIYFPLGSDEAARVQEYFGDVAAEGTTGSMSLLEWLVLMQVIPSIAASKAVDEWTAAWRHSSKAPDDTWYLCAPDEQRMRIVIEAAEMPMLVRAPVKYAGPRLSANQKFLFLPTFPGGPVEQAQAVQNLAKKPTQDPDEDDPFEQEEHT
jgi:hypothetical protein